MKTENKIHSPKHPFGTDSESSFEVREPHAQSGTSLVRTIRSTICPPNIDAPLKAFEMLIDAPQVLLPVAVLWDRFKHFNPGR